MKATSSLTRRDFVKTSALALASTTVRPFGAESVPAAKSAGIQVGAVSFVDEGVEPVLDIFQKAAVDTIYLTTFTYGRGLAGRQIPGQPFPDHGKQESDEKTFRGGNCKCRILPGIDIDIPTGRNSRKATPDDTYAATKAALAAGAHGVILSRKYSEMRLANLAGAGKAVREFMK